jgi:hypothetical protein
MTQMKNRTKRRRYGGMAALLAALALAVVVAGCGSSGGGSSSESSTTTAGSSGGSSQESGSTQEGATGRPGGFELSDEARTCLKEQGFEPPEPGQGGPEGGGPPEGGGLPEGGPPTGAGSEKFMKMREALEECGVEMTGKPGGPRTNSAAFKKQVKEYAACMRENGVAMPEPNLSGEGPVFDESEVNPESSEFKKASEQCQSLLGGPKGGSEPEAGSETESGSET